jgi:signal transduction histidine kinase
MVPACLYGQTIKDTLFINAAGTGEYAVNKHLYIYKTEKSVTPGFVYDTSRPNDFITIFPANSFNDLRHPSNYYWLLLTVKNNLPYDETFYYQLNHPKLYSVIAYKNEGNGFVWLGKSGFAYPFSQKMYHYYDNVFPIVLKSGQAAAILLNININNGYNPYFAPQFSNANTFKAKEQKFYMVNGIITGIMVTAFLLNIFLGVSLKQKLHFLYSAYIICVLYEIFLSQGLDSQYLYPDGNNMLNLMRYVIPCTGIVLLAFVMQVFLNQRRSNSRLKFFVDVTNYTCIGITLFYSILFLTSQANGFYTSLYQTALACLAIIQMLFVFASAVEKAIQGQKIAWFYIAAILCLFTGIFEYGLIFLGVNAAEASIMKHPNDMQTGLVVETLVVFFGIVYRYNLFKKEKEVLLTEINTHQNKMINSIVGAQEEERKRIAEDLHDDVGATLSALAMHISNIPESFNKTGDVESYYKRGIFLSNKAVGDIRTIAHNLLPKDFKTTGLFQVLEKRIEDMNALGKIQFNLIIEGDEERLPEVFAITVYRVINELLTNILKHSMAAEASIQLLIEENCIQIMAEDDGIGFNREMAGHNGIGLKNITGRVEFLKGRINMDTNQHGTTTVISIPL